MKVNKGSYIDLYGYPRWIEYKLFDPRIYDFPVVIAVEAIAQWDVIGAPTTGVAVVFEPGKVYDKDYNVKIDIKKEVFKYLNNVRPPKEPHLDVIDLGNGVSELPCPFKLPTIAGERK